MYLKGNFGFSTKEFNAKTKISVLYKFVKEHKVRVNKGTFLLFCFWIDLNGWKLKYHKENQDMRWSTTMAKNKCAKYKNPYEFVHDDDWEDCSEELWRIPYSQNVNIPFYMWATPTRPRRRPRGRRSWRRRHPHSPPRTPGTFLPSIFKSCLNFLLLSVIKNRILLQVE